MTALERKRRRLVEMRVFALQRVRPCGRVGVVGVVGAGGEPKVPRKRPSPLPPQLTADVLPSRGCDGVRGPPEGLFTVLSGGCRGGLAGGEPPRGRAVTHHRTSPCQRPSCCGRL